MNAQGHGRRSSAWPAGGERPGGDRPFLPLAYSQQVERIRAGAAVTAFAERRTDQLLRFDHSPDADLDQAIDYLVREAMSRLHAFIEITGKNRMMAPPAARRDLLLRKIDIAGALLIAARDRFLAAPDDRTAQ